MDLRELAKKLEVGSLASARGGIEGMLKMLLPVMLAIEDIEKAYDAARRIMKEEKKLALEQQATAQAFEDSLHELVVNRAQKAKEFSLLRQAWEGQIAILEAEAGEWEERIVQEQNTLKFREANFAAQCARIQSEHEVRVEALKSQVREEESRLQEVQATVAELKAKLGA